MVGGIGIVSQKVGRKPQEQTNWRPWMLGGVLCSEPALSHVGIGEQRSSKGFRHLSTDPKHSWGRSSGSRPLSTSAPWWQRTPRFTSQLCLPGVSPHAVHFPTHVSLALPSSLLHAEADAQLFLWPETVRVSPIPCVPGAWPGQCVPVRAPANNEVLSALLREPERAQPGVSHMWLA